MQKIAIIQISEEGKNIARLLLSQIFAQKNEAEIISRANVGKRWKDFDAFVFVGAMGICVRTIAPYIKDKHEDPAVLMRLSLLRATMPVYGRSTHLQSDSTGPLPATMT